MAIVLGLDAKLFRGEAGTQATIEVTNVKDVSLTLESGEADVTTRAAQGWAQAPCHRAHPRCDAHHRRRR